MKGKVSLLGIAATIVATAVSVVAATSGFHVFGSSAYTVVVSRADTSGPAQLAYSAWTAQDLAKLALGATPGSNQVFALAMNCGLSAAKLVVYNKSNSEMITVAQTTSLDVLPQADPATGVTNEERFVAVFVIVPVGNLAGGYLTMAGRVHVNPNGCPTAVSANKDRNPFDRIVGDQDVTRLAKGSRLPDNRSGQAHFMGALDVISGGQTNTVLVPNGHLTTCNELN